MEAVKTNNVPGRQSILATFIEILSEMTSDWDKDFSGEINAETLLVAQLGFTSMDLVMLVVEIQQRYGRQDLPFENLFAPNGKYVSDLRVADVVNFLYRHLNR
ncbi:MAG TPA: acyl carrier protein [Pyrinomonadaceae bacterium]|jgi:acyl carrier protein|nr:acyl carrier protein [Pyrinomonadaceae bacterium]